jgi:hypothetical protein
VGGEDEGKGKKEAPAEVAVIEVMAEAEAVTGSNPRAACEEGAGCGAWHNCGKMGH